MSRCRGMKFGKTSFCKVIDEKDFEATTNKGTLRISRTTYIFDCNNMMRESGSHTYGAE